MLQPKLILTPAQAIARARIAPRNAPKPKVSAAMNGWMEWGLVDRRGRVVSGGQCHNLVLDTMLDDFAQHTGFTLNTASGLQQWLTHCAVGTGSTAPAVTDTGLVAQAGTRTNTHTITNVDSRPSNGVYEFQCEYEFDYANANGNLTEWGLSRGASASLLVRELFRDELDNPVTVTKTSDFKLRIKYTLRMTLTPIVLTAGSFAITGIGTINGDYTMMGASNADVNAFSHVANNNLILDGATSFKGVVTVSATASGGYTTAVGGAQAIASYAISPFVSGVWEREVDIVLGTAQGNITIATIGYFLGSSATGNERCGFGFTIDVADRFTKNDLHTLSIERAVGISWGRDGSI